MAKTGKTVTIDVRANLTFEMPLEDWRDMLSWAKEEGVSPSDARVEALEQLGSDIEGCSVDIPYLSGTAWVAVVDAIDLID